MILKPFIDYPRRLRNHRMKLLLITVVAFLWTYSYPRSTFWDVRVSNVTPQIALASGTVYSLSENGIFLAIDEHTGKIKWRRNFSGDSFSMAVEPRTNTVYVGLKNTLVRMDGYTGSILWERNTGLNDGCELSFEGDMLIATGLGGAVRIMPDGEVKWKYPLASALEYITVSANRVFICTSEPSLHCLDSATGRRIWRKDTGYIHSLTKISVDAIAVVDGSLHILSQRNGDELWQLQENTAKPVVYGNNLYYALGRAVYMVPLTGGPPHLVANTNRKLASQILVRGQYLYVCADVDILLKVDTVSCKVVRIVNMAGITSRFSLENRTWLALGSSLITDEILGSDNNIIAASRYGHVFSVSTQ